MIAVVGCKENLQDTTIDTFDADVHAKVEYEPEYGGGELVLPLTTIRTLNPLINENMSYYHFSKLIYEGLFELGGDDLNIVNQLAEDYTLKEEGRVVSIKLREDVFWHDGEKFTADDVAFTINTIKYANDDTSYKKMFNNALGSYSPLDIRRILDVQILDDYHIDIIFSENFGHGLETLTFPILPKHKFVLGKEDKNSYIQALSEENFEPIGTGPYMFVEYDKHKTIFLKSYDKYREGKPYIDTIIGKILEDEELSLTAFETGQVHVTTALDVDWENMIRIIELEYLNLYLLIMSFRF